MKKTKNSQAFVRLATKDDIPRILELYEQLSIGTANAELNRSPTLEEYRSVFTEFTRIPRHEILVAEYNREVVGTIVFLIEPNLSHRALPWALVENVIVDEKYRRYGFGKLLMEYAINRAKEAGCYRVVLTSDKRRKEAHQFYRSLGFEASAEGFRLYF
jgi:GNAT superfamily N-acetyltransferase